HLEHRCTPLLAPAHPALRGRWLCGASTPSWRSRILRAALHDSERETLIGKPLSPEVARRFSTRDGTPPRSGPRAVKQIVRVRAPAAGDSRGLAQLLQAYMGEALSMAWGGAA